MPVPTAGGDGIEGLAITGVTGLTVHLLLANQNHPHAPYEADLTLPDPITGALSATLTAAHPQPAVNLSEVMLEWGSRRLLVLHWRGPARAARRVLHRDLAPHFQRGRDALPGFAPHRAGPRRHIFAHRRLRVTVSARRERGTESVFRARCLMAASRSSLVDPDSHRSLSLM